MSSMAASSFVDFDQSLIGDMVRQALDDSCQQCGLASAVDVTRLIESGSRPVTEYVAYGIAVRAAEFVGLTDSQVQSVHLFEASPDGDDPVFPLPLLFVVDRETAALGSLLDLMDKALLKECKQRLGSYLPAKLTNVLNAHVVTTKQVQERSGFAGLLSAYYNPPLTLWRR